VLSVINEDNSISIEEKIEILREKLVAESPDHIKEHIRSQHQQFRNDAKRLFSFSGGHNKPKESTPLRLKLGQPGTGREPLGTREDAVASSPKDDERPRADEPAGRYKSGRPAPPVSVSAHSDSASQSQYGGKDDGEKHEGSGGEREHEEGADITLARIPGNIGAFPDIQVVENRQPSHATRTAASEDEAGDIKVASIEDSLGAFPKIQIIQGEDQQYVEKVERFPSEVTKKTKRPKKKFFKKQKATSNYKPSGSITRNSSVPPSRRLSAFGFSKFQVSPQKLEIARFDYDSAGHLVLVNSRGASIARAPQGSSIPIKEHLPKPSPSYSITPVYIKNTVSKKNLDVQRRIQDQFNHLQGTGSRTNSRAI